MSSTPPPATGEQPAVPSTPAPETPTGSPPVRTAPMPAVQAEVRSNSVADGNLAQPMELRSFLLGLGVVFRLERRAKPRPEAVKVVEAPTSVPAGTGRRGVLLVAAAAVALVAAGGFVAAPLFSSGPEVVPSIPAQAHGVWSTKAARHAGRVMELTETTIAFEVGEKGSSRLATYQVEKVERDPRADTLMITVHYASPEGARTAELGSLESPTRKLWFRSQPDVIWTPVPKAR